MSWWFIRVHKLCISELSIHYDLSMCESIMTYSKLQWFQVSLHIMIYYYYTIMNKYYHAKSKTYYSRILELSIKINAYLTYTSYLYYTINMSLCLLLDHYTFTFAINHNISNALLKIVWMNHEALTILCELYEW